jgi:AraC-like DNA-binding protein
MFMVLKLSHRILSFHGQKDFFHVLFLLATQRIATVQTGLTTEGLDVMRLIDTTNPQAHAHAHALLTTPKSCKAFELASAFRVHIVGLFYTRFGLDWSSGGKRECDFMHHIELPLSGKRQIIHGQHCLALNPGTAYFLPGNIPVERRSEKGGDVVYLKIRCEWLPGVDPLLDWSERTPMPIGTFDPHVWRVLQKAESWSDASRLLWLHSQVECWLSVAIPTLSTLLERHRETHAHFSKVFSLVETKLGADLRISDLAKLHGTTLRVFSKAFTASTQITPKEYLNRRLNQEAIQLVISTDLKIKEIAERLRFTDEFYFSRFFQKLNGVPPSKYRNRFYA